MFGELVYETRAIQMYMHWRDHAQAIWDTTVIILIILSFYRHIKMFKEFFTTVPTIFNGIRIMSRAYAKMSRDWLIGLCIIYLPPTILIPKHMLVRPAFQVMLGSMFLLFCFMMLCRAVSKTQKTDV